MLKNLIKALNWVDVLIIILLIRTCCIGLSKGLFVEVFKVIGLICALVITIHSYSQIGEFINSHSILSLTVSNVISVIILLCAILIIFKLLRIILQSLIKIEVAPIFNKFGGFILGLGRGFILGSFILFMLTLLPSDYMKNSVNNGLLSSLYSVKVAPVIHYFIVKFLPSPK